MLPSGVSQSQFLQNSVITATMSSNNSSYSSLPQSLATTSKLSSNDGNYLANQFISNTNSYTCYNPIYPTQIVPPVDYGNFHINSTIPPIPSNPYNINLGENNNNSNGTNIKMIPSTKSTKNKTTHNNNNNNINSSSVDNLSSINTISKTEPATPLNCLSDELIKLNQTTKIVASTATTSIMSCDTSSAIISTPIPNYDGNCGNKGSGVDSGVATTTAAVANYASVYAAAVGNNNGLGGYGNETNADLLDNHTNNTNNGGEYCWPTNNLQQHHNNSHPYQNGGLMSNYLSNESSIYPGISAPNHLHYETELASTNSISGYAWPAYYLPSALEDKNNSVLPPSSHLSSYMAMTDRNFYPSSSLQGICSNGLDPFSNGVSATAADLIGDPQSQLSSNDLYGFHDPSLTTQPHLMSLDVAPQFAPNNNWTDLNGVGLPTDSSSIYPAVIPPPSQLGLLDGYSTAPAVPLHIPTTTTTAGGGKTTALKRRLNTSKSNINTTGTSSGRIAGTSTNVPCPSISSGIGPQQQLGLITPTASTDYCNMGRRATSASTASSLSPSGLGAIKAARRGRSRSHNTTKETSDDDSRSNEDKEMERRNANNTRERIRVRDINTAFKDLARLISQHVPNAEERSLTKLGTLLQAVELIPKLEEKVRQKNMDPRMPCMKRQQQSNLSASASGTTLPNCEINASHMNLSMMTPNSSIMQQQQQQISSSR